MTKFTKGQVVFAAAVLAVAVIAALAAVKIAAALKNPKYVAVYLETGEIYFGKMRWFPSPRLSNVMFVQQAQQGQGLMLDRFTNAVWKPAEPLRISRGKIVFWTYLEPESPIVQAIEGKITPIPAPPPSPTPSPTPTR